MRITLCGSIKNADKIVEIYRQLEKIGHEPIIHEDMFGLVDGTAKQLKEVKTEGAEVKRKFNFIKAWHKLIVSGDAILVCNFNKDGVKNYIGGNVLMEIGFAHVNDKKIFLLNPIPEEVSYADEIKAMVDVILYGDLKKIS